MMAAPATEVVPLDGCIVVVRGDDPRDWATPESLHVEQTIAAHLGADLFFDRTDQDRPGRAPDWGARAR